MEFLKKSYLYTPILVILFIFLFDKIFLLPIVRDNFIQPGGMLYYRQRKEQLEILKNYKIPSQKKLTIVLGDSRAFSIGNEVANYIQIPDLDIWNFAGPQAVIAYHFYIASQIYEYKKPDYFYIGISPDALNRNAGIFGNPILRYGVDEKFIQLYRNLIPEKDYKDYIFSKKYALQGLQFSFKPLIERIKGSLLQPDLEKELKKFNLNINQLSLEEQKILHSLLSFRVEDLNYYVYKKSPQRMLLNFTKGAQYAWFGKMSDENLKKETEKLKQIYFTNFSISEEQFIFLELLLKKIKQEQSKAILFIPRVNPYLKEVYSQSEEIQIILNRFKDIAHQYKFPILDMNLDSILTCNEFYDSSHLSVSCFPEVLKILYKKTKEL